MLLLPHLFLGGVTLLKDRWNFHQILSSTYLFLEVPYKYRTGGTSTSCFNFLSHESPQSALFAAKFRLPMEPEENAGIPPLSAVVCGSALQQQAIIARQQRLAAVQQPNVAAGQDMKPALDTDLFAQPPD